MRKINWNEFWLGFHEGLVKAFPVAVPVYIVLLFIALFQLANQR